MANEVYTEDQAFFWDEVSGGSGWRLAGFVNGGGPTGGYDLRERTGANRERINRAGLTTYGGNIQFLPVGDGWDLLDEAFDRTNLKFAIHTGHDYELHDDSYVRSVEWSVSNDNAFSVSMEFDTMPPLGSSGAPSPWTTAMTKPEANLEEYECGVTLSSATGYSDGYWSTGSNDLGVQSITARAEFPVQFTYSVSSKSSSGTPASGKRYPRDLTMRAFQRMVEVSTLEVLVPPTVDLERDYPLRDIAVAFTGTTNDDTPKTIAIAISGMMYNGRPTRDYVSDDESEVIWSCPLAPENMRSSAMTWTVS